MCKLLNVPFETAAQSSLMPSANLVPFWTFPNFPSMYGMNEKLPQSSTTESL